MKSSIKRGLVGKNKLSPKLSQECASDITAKNKPISADDASLKSKHLTAQALLSDKLITVGTLASGIVHEINNPITWVMANLNYLKTELEKMKAKDPSQEKKIEKLEEAINDSIHGCNKVREIVLNLKSFIHVDEKKITSFDLNEEINVIIKMISLQFKNSVKIETSLAEEMPMLLFNKNKLDQVIMNLLINAAQAIEENKSKDNVIQIRTYLNDESICIDITDTGKGIPPEIMPKIFKPFFTTKPSGVGTGLGLSLCNEIIQSLGGEICVVSEINRGSTFSIFLPLQLCSDAKKNNKA